jgi:hypothetical protein
MSTDNASLLSIAHASEVLGSSFHKDYKKYFDAVCSKASPTTTTSFRAYVDHVVADPLKWLSSFPENLHSKSAFSKPKTALLNLLGHSDVCNALGEDYCMKAAQVVQDIFKQHANSIVHQRITAKQQQQRSSKNAGDDAHCTLGDGDGNGFGPSTTTASQYRKSSKKQQGGRSGQTSQQQQLEAARLELELVSKKLEDLKSFVLRLASTLEEKDIFKGESLRELMRRW